MPQVGRGSLASRKEKSRILLEAIGEAVLGTDLRGSISYLNHVAEAMTGWSGHECAGLNIADVAPLVDPCSHELIWETMLRAIRRRPADPDRGRAGAGRAGRPGAPGRPDGRTCARTQWPPERGGGGPARRHRGPGRQLQEAHLPCRA
ncbi:PAS domain-containing protein [Massilia sp. B-10]|nr:PAS domain-containing protein [Massilia sp. B-10]